MNKGGKELTKEEFVEWYGTHFKRRAKFITWLAKAFVFLLQIWIMVVLVTIIVAINAWVIGVWF